MKRAKPPAVRFDVDERVLVIGYQTRLPGTVVEKTLGASTRIRFDDGRTMLISNHIIEREVKPIPRDRPAR